jgi:CheY-like chemotaxis protein
VHPDSVRIELTLLGRFRATRGGESLELTPHPAAVLITIALAGEISVEQICAHMDNAQGQSNVTKPGTIHKHKSNVEAAGFKIGDRPDGKRTRYFLDRELYAIDAERFTDGVRCLPETVGPGEMDALLALWNGDPRQNHRYVDPVLWNPVYQARDALIGRIGRLDPSRRGELSQLPRFAGLYPADPAVAPVRPAGDRSARKRLLIVEDKVGDSIVSELEEEGYECELVTTWDQWKKLRDTGLPAYDGAIVDLHLKGRDDARGERVVAYLRDHTQIPAAVVTSNAERISLREKRQWQAAYRIVDLVEKNEGDLYLRQLVGTARLLTGDDDSSRRERLQIWVDHALREAEREAEAGGELARERLRRCQQAALDAERAIRLGSVEEAQREVDALCRSFPPQAGRQG